MFLNRCYVTLGCKRKRRDELTEDLGTMLTELNAQTMTHLDEHQRKFMLLEAELEEKRRRQEQQHEQRMMEMMMTFIRQVANPSTTPTFVTPGPPIAPTPPFVSHTPYNYSLHHFPSPPPSHANPSHSSSPHPSQYYSDYNEED